MTLREALAVVRERWRVTIAVVFIVGLAGLATALILPTSYTSNLKLYVSAQSQGNSDTAYQGSLLSQQRVRSYTELITSPRVANESLTRLGSRETTEEFLSHITASSALDSVLIDVNATESDPASAARTADAVGQVFTEVVGEIEQPTTPGVAPPVTVRVVQPGTVPTKPSSPSPVLIVLGAVIVGALVGAGFVVVARILDTSIRSVEQVRALTQAPSLGTVPASDNFGSGSLVVSSAPQSPEAESFRQIRTSIDFVDIDGSLSSIAITSSRAAEGKTTTATNLAAVVASSGRRTILIDGDLRKPSAARVLGLEESVGLTSVLGGRVPLMRAIQRKSPENFDLLSSGPLPPNPSEMLGSRQMQAVLRELETQYELIVIDTPPLLPVTDAASLAALVDGVVIVCSYERTKQDELQRSAEILQAGTTKILGSVLTRVPTSGPGGYAEYRAAYGANVDTTLEDVRPVAVSERGHYRHRDDMRERRQPVPHKRTGPGELQ